ncbi:MAG: multidrug transporter, partial [Myxococcales bacterium]|nr:multidrug transporter [Myxococcales bacterium]
MPGLHLRVSSPCSLAVSVLLVLGCRGVGDGEDEVAAETESTGDELGDSGDAQTESGSDSDTGSESDTDTGATDILDQLQAIEGMTVEELPALDDGTRVFELYYLQPNDHEHPEGPWFEQHLFLQHRDVAAPMVLFTTGYSLYFGPSYTSEPATLLQANQLSTEQRFFGTSRPDPLDWSLLTIAQAAADHHRLVQALAPIYGGSWLSTGASKGGMTSVYHRRFYPDDVDATVAYVAPHSFSAWDERYPIYLDEVGEPDCAQAIRDFQIEALARRQTLVPLLIETAMNEGYTYERYGGDYQRVFEAGVVEVRWAFWQYAGKPHCPFVPTVAATDQEIHAFINKHQGWDSYSDNVLAFYEPYYYQAAHQLGAPAITEPHLEGLLDFPVNGGWDPLLPAGTTFEHDPAAMLDISTWLAGEGER